MMLYRLREQQKKLMQAPSNFYTPRGTHVYFKDALLNKEIDVERVVARLENSLPEHLLSDLEMIVVGWFEEFEERNINAFYKDGILHVSNIQSSEEDLYDDLVHETAHSIENIYGYEIYSDYKIKEEFLRKREYLRNLLVSMGFSIPSKYFSEVEYNPDFDDILLKDVGYDKLGNICKGLFISPYAPTSLREYFATGFTDFYLNPDHGYLKKVSPELYKKILLLHNPKKLDNQ